MDNVRDMGSKLERWLTAYDHNVGDFTIQVSSHGRLKLSFAGDVKYVLSLTNAVAAMQGVLKAYVRQGFNPDDEPPTADNVFMKLR